MTVEKLIKELQKYNPKAVVRLHHPEGDVAIFAVGYEYNDSVVTIEGKEDNDLRSEISARFENADKIADTELGFFEDLLEIGITLDDIKQYYPEKYEYSKEFMINNNLIKEGE
jgi:hypothetical protein